MRFRSFFGREYKKTQICENFFFEALFSLYSYKQHIADGFRMVDISLIDQEGVKGVETEQLQ